MELVLASLDRLPEKYAEPSRIAGSYRHWHRRQQPLKIGRLSKQPLRQEYSIDDLFPAYEYEDDCLEEKRRTA